MPLSVASSEQQCAQASKGIGEELIIRGNGKCGRGGGGGEKEEKGRLIYKNHLSFVSALLCRLHFVINFSLLICNILATLYMLNFSNNAFSKSQSIRLSHFLMNVFTLGKPEYFLPICVTASSIKFVTSI